MKLIGQYPNVIVRAQYRPHAWPLNAGDGGENFLTMDGPSRKVYKESGLPNELRFHQSNHGF
jgi:hypothetical protein